MNSVRKAAIFKRLGIAVLLALLMTFLGFFGGLGYRVNQIAEVSFVPHGMYGYADASFTCDITFNPILYPFYWVTGRGQVSGRFAMIYLPDANSLSGRRSFGTREDRYSGYIMHMIAWGTIPNLGVLLMFALAIEFIGKRSLYFVLFGGMLGFYASSLVGIIPGAAIGSLAMMFTAWLPKDSRLLQFWNSLWE